MTTHTPRVLYEGVRQAPSVDTHAGRQRKGQYFGCLQPTTEEDDGGC